MPPTSDDLQSRLDLAVSAAREASSLILGYYQSSDLEVISKSDNSPVTEADRGAELLLRDIISGEFPDDAVLGEEFPEKPGTNGYRWYLDPIDGTKSFVHGVPLFGTLIGLEYNDEDLVAGVCRFPALDEVVYASRGGGCWWQIGSAEPRRAQVAAHERLEDSVFTTTTMTRWEAIGKKDVFEHLCRTCKLTRGWGDCYGHVLVATGRTDVMIDPSLNAWDAAALVPILQEAGGHFVDFQGNASIHSGNGLSVSDALKPVILDLLK